MRGLALTLLLLLPQPQPLVAFRRVRQTKPPSEY